MHGLDTGTIDSLLDASNYVGIIQRRQGIAVSAPEEIAFNKGLITTEQLLDAAKKYGKSPYGQYLLRVAQNKILD